VSITIICSKGAIGDLNEGLKAKHQQNSCYKMLLCKNIAD